MTYVAFAVIAAGVNDLLEQGQAVGTASNQQILGGLIVLFGLILIYRERQQNKRQKEDARHHEELIAKIDGERSSMTAERVARLNMLMEIVKENTIAFRDLKGFLEHAVRIERRAE